MENIVFKNPFENEDLNFKKSKFTESQDKLYLHFQKDINYYLNLVQCNIDIDYKLNIFKIKIKNLIKYNKGNPEITNNVKFVKYILTNIHNECFIYILKYMNLITNNDLFYVKNSYTLIQMEQHTLLKKNFTIFCSNFILYGNIGIINEIHNNILKLLLLPNKNNKVIIDSLFDIINLCTLLLMLYV